MNAYDIAKDLDREGKFPGHVCYGTSPLLVRAANMLRKQADRIAELEKLTREPTKVFAVPDLMAKAGFFKRGERVASQIQTKPLSDDEIFKLGSKLRISTTEIEYNWHPVVLEFARAIEERHGIK